MTWELVAQIALIMFAAIVFIMLVTGIVSAMLDARARRNIRMYEAGLMPKGWKHHE